MLLSNRKHSSDSLVRYTSYAWSSANKDRAAYAIVLLMVLALVVGCGSGGYAGQGISSLSSSSVTIDAGQSFQVSASLSGNGPVSWKLGSAACSNSTCGTLSTTTGTAVTYTAPSGISSQIKVTLSATLSGTANTQTVNITINPDPTISGTLPPGSVGEPYSATLSAAGGTAPLTWSLNGALPDGLSFDAKTGTISGTPTKAGSTNFTAQVTDSSDVPYTVKAAETIAVSVPVTALELLSGNPPNGTVGVAYQSMLQASGGVAPYTYSVTAGSLPAGLTLGASGSITGTPTTAGTATFTGEATDAAGSTATRSFNITISAAGTGGGGTLTLSPLPGATVGVPYMATVGVTGGTAPYTCAEVSGSLPAGLTMSSACVVSGTPTTAQTATVVVKATDSATPAGTVTGPETITVSAAGSTSGTLSMSPLPGATVGVPYMATIGVAGGTAPYNCVEVSGNLPAGLTLSAACVVSGTPTTAQTATVVVKATDSATPAGTVTGPETITVTAASSLTLASPPSATVGTPYSGMIGVSGGTAPYDCVIVSGTLPSGLTLGAHCLISGTPTVAGTVMLGVRATDSGNPVAITTGPVSLTVQSAPPSLTITAPPSATVNVPYTGTIGVTGGTAPYTCALTGGTLPSGLSLSASCVVSGTPGVAGSSTVTVKATDGSQPAGSTTGPVTITVLPGGTLSLSAPPTATVGEPYSGAIGVSGGTAPYTCSVTAGTLPLGLSLGASCTITGTPTTAGTTAVTIHATDSTTPTAETVTGPVTITVSPVSPLSLTGSLPNAILGQPYQQTLQATGGVKPYTYAVTAGSLPAGLSLAADGTISGTPTQPGASSFTATVTDTEPTPQTASLPLVLLVVYPTTATDPLLTGPYAFLFQGYDDVAAGVLAYQTATIGSFTADGAGAIGSGELDANHQASNPAGETVSSHTFVGTYTLGADDRGLMTITTLNADGTTGATSTYSITAKAPVAPATVASQVDMIEFDDNNLRGTRGSGTMLAQQPAAFTAGLNGSYAFGLSGDTPCLPACTVGIVAGPAASVGQFTTDGSSLLSSGTSDANIATTNYANEPLTGSYGAADGNGRLALTMQTAGTPQGVFPGDYAVYVVSPSQVFVMSTDKHAKYVLLAGTAQLQTQATFGNAAMNGAIIGYENSQTSPGFLGVTLGDVLNLSSATLFRATGNGAGNCNFTNVDVAGLTGLVNGLAGLGNNATVLNALLGTYQSTGASTCTVGANGRGTLTYPAPNTTLANLLRLLGLSTNPPAPRQFYLIGPGNGYFLETGYAGLGRFEPQTGSPYTKASLDGTYVYASQPAASLASTNSSGTFTADGNGNATSTMDLNVGVGTLNVLQAGVTASYTYHVTDATAGRFLIGTTVVLYEIAPGRFVLVDTAPTTTSPTITLLY